MTEPTLADVLAELKALRSELACLRVPRLAATDFATLARVLPAIRGAVGVRVFAIAELAEHATLPTPKARALRAALVPLDAGATRRLGKLFSRALCVHVAELLVQNVGSDRDGAVWMVGETFSAERPAPAHDTLAAIGSNQSVGKQGGKSMALERVSDLTRQILSETRARFSIARLMSECGEKRG